MNEYTSNTDFLIHLQKVVNSGEAYYSSLFGANSNHTDYSFNSNSGLKFGKAGEFHLGSLKFQRGAKLYAPAEGVILHVGNDFQ